MEQVLAESCLASKYKEASPRNRRQRQIQTTVGKKTHEENYEEQNSNLLKSLQVCSQAPYYFSLRSESPVDAPHPDTYRRH